MGPMALFLLVGLVLGGQPKVTVKRWANDKCDGDPASSEEYTEPCGSGYDEDSANDDTKCECDNIKKNAAYAANLASYGSTFDDYDKCFTPETGQAAGIVYFKIECGDGGSKTMVILILMAIGIAGLVALYLKFTGGASVTNNDVKVGSHRGSVYQGVQMENFGPEWTEYKDPEGTPYWYNSETQETSWYRPKSNVPVPETKLLPASDRNNWTRYEDDSGTPYWYNAKTQESAWVEPQFAEKKMPAPPPVPAAAKQQNVVAAAQMANDNPEATKAAVNFAKDNPEAAKKAAKWASNNPDTAKNVAGGLAAAFKTS